jgi:TRAP-type C4-dicarboxylate transport system substrate-binding protein
MMVRSGSVDVLEGEKVKLNSLKCLAFLAVAWYHQDAFPANARDFRVADTQPEDYPTVQALMFVDQLVNERTGGRHRIRVFHSRQLGEEKETIEQTRVGAIDLNRTNVAPLGSFVPEANVLVLPFLFRSMDHLYNVLDSGARSIYNSVRPVRSLADLKGLRIRVQQSDLMIATIKALGAEAVAMPYGQVLTGLTTRLIDGAENNWPSYVTTNHFTAARHYTVTEHNMSPEVLVMSRKAWDSLSAEDQKIFRAAAQESGTFMRQQWKAWEERAREQARKAGVMVVTEFDRRPFVDAMSEIYQEALSDPKLRQLVDRILKVK